MKYIAKIDIGDFKKGDEVPEEKALAWKNMYLESPVEEVSASSKVSEKPEVLKKEPQVKKKIAKKKSKSKK